MSENQQIWANLAHTLQRWGLKELVAFLLESAGALNVMIAQVVYISQPLFSGTVNPALLEEFAQVLENPSTRAEFISFLKEVPLSGSIT